MGDGRPGGGVRGGPEGGTVRRLGSGILKALRVEGTTPAALTRTRQADRRTQITQKTQLKTDHQGSQSQGGEGGGSGVYSQIWVSLAFTGTQENPHRTCNSGVFSHSFDHTRTHDRKT